MLLGRTAGGALRRLLQQPAPVPPADSGVSSTTRICELAHNLFLWPAPAALRMSSAMHALSRRPPAPPPLLRSGLCGIGSAVSGIVERSDVRAQVLGPLAGAGGAAPRQPATAQAACKAERQAGRWRDKTRCRVAWDRRNATACARPALRSAMFADAHPVVCRPESSAAASSSPDQRGCASPGSAAGCLAPVRIARTQLVLGW